MATLTTKVRSQQEQVGYSDAHHSTSRTSAMRPRSYSVGAVPSYSPRVSQAFARSKEDLESDRRDFRVQEREVYPWPSSLFSSREDIDDLEFGSFQGPLFYDSEDEETRPLLDSQDDEFGYDPDEFDTFASTPYRTVGEVAVDRRVPRSNVEGLNAYYRLDDEVERFPLFDPSGSLSPSTLLQISDVTDESARLQITEVPRKKVTLYNAYHDASGNTKGHYFDMKAKHHDKLQETFYDIKDHCLASGQMPGDATGFTINWSKRVVRFYDPSIGHVRTLDLDKMMQANPDINDKVLAAEELISTKINKGSIRNHKIAPNNKGAYDGAAPLYRSNQVLDTLPKSIGDKPYKAAMTLAQNVLTDDLQKDAAIHRMGKAETIIKKTKDKVAQEKAALVPLWTAEQNPARKTQLQKSIEELTALEQRLNSIDTFALYSALAFYPQDDNPRPEDVYQRAQMLQKQSADMLQQAREQAVADGTKRSWYPAWAPFSSAVRGEPKIDESRFYPVDVGGVMFSGLEFPEARSGYVDYCRAHSVHCKGDGLEDALLREVLRPGSTGNGDNPVLQHLFDDITDPDIKGRLETSRNAAINDPIPAPALTLNGADSSARVDDYRQKAALV